MEYRGSRVAWLELVPNVSEGRDVERIAALVQAFRRPGVHLLDVDRGAAANRSVITLAGPAEALIEAAVAGAREAMGRIDLRAHEGVHPRMGALDVCPFVPLDGATMGEAIAAARETAARLGDLGLPTWLYGEAATRPERRLLKDVRRDGFEGLAARMPGDPPDFGPPGPHPSAGGVAVGARFLLVAYNICLDTPDAAVAARIARSVRQFRRVVRDAHGNPLGREAGGLPEVRAIGWSIEEYGCAQVSTNLTDWRVTPPHVVLAAVRAEARALGAEVTGAELVGCVPIECLRAAARADGAGDATDVDLVARGVRALGLDAVKPFDPRRKVLEWALEGARTGDYDGFSEVPC